MNRPAFPFLFFLPVHHSPASIPHLTPCFRAFWLPFPVPNTHFALYSLSFPTQLMVQTLILGRFSLASSTYVPFPTMSQHILAQLTDPSPNLTWGFFWLLMPCPSWILLLYPSSQQNWSYSLIPTQNSLSDQFLVLGHVSSSPG